ncbi:MAG: CatB-related O-acetyltransferase [Paracoccaceae bacterium]
MPIPDPSRLHPIILPGGSPHKGTVMLACAVRAHARWQVGDYTYASDSAAPTDWASHLAPYLYPFSREKLQIGRFCQIAQGVRFITSSANHAQSGLTCYPFPVFDPDRMSDYQPDQRDTVIGHDVWVGTNAMILPGAHIGNGAIIGAGAVVRGTIPDYAIVTGNPGTVARYRFSLQDISMLQTLAWWNWSPDLLVQAERALLAGDLDALERFAP